MPIFYLFNTTITIKKHYGICPFNVLPQNSIVLLLYNSKVTYDGGRHLQCYLKDMNDRDDNMLELGHSYLVCGKF